MQVKHFICGWLAWVLRMERPGGTVNRRILMQRSRLNDAKMDALDEKSRSLMANVLDIEDDLRMANGSANVMMTTKVGFHTVRCSFSCSLILLDMFISTFGRKKKTFIIDIREQQTFIFEN